MKRSPPVHPEFYRDSLLSFAAAIVDAVATHWEHELPRAVRRALDTGSPVLALRPLPAETRDGFAHLVSWANANDSFGERAALDELEATLEEYGPLCDHVVDPPLPTLRADLEIILRLQAEGIELSEQAANASGITVERLHAAAVKVLTLSLSAEPLRGRGRPPIRDANALLSGAYLHLKRRGGVFRTSIVALMYATAIGRTVTRKDRVFWARYIKTFDPTAMDLLMQQPAMAPIPWQFPWER